MLSDPVAEAFGLIHRHPRVKTFPVVESNSWHDKLVTSEFYERLSLSLYEKKDDKRRLFVNTTKYQIGSKWALHIF